MLFYLLWCFSCKLRCFVWPAARRWEARSYACVWPDPEPCGPRCPPENDPRKKSLGPTEPGPLAPRPNSPAASPVRAEETAFWLELLALKWTKVFQSDIYCHGLVPQDGQRLARAADRDCQGQGIFWQTVCQLRLAIGKANCGTPQLPTRDG